MPLSSSSFKHRKLFNWATEFSKCTDEDEIIAHINNIQDNFKTSYQILGHFSKSNFVSEYEDTLNFSEKEEALPKERKKRKRKVNNEDDYILHIEDGCDEVN